MLDILAFYLALMTLIMLLCGQTYWFLMHPFIHFWRTIGSKRTYMIVLPLVFTMALLLFLFRNRLLAIRFAPNPFLIGLGALSYVLNTYLYIQSRKFLGTRTLFGLSELAADNNSGTFIFQGIYRRTRNPRYISGWFFIFAIAAMTNYLAIWLLLPFSVLGFYIIIRFEEKELYLRFGDRYADYVKRVPRFFLFSRVEPLNNEKSNGCSQQ